MKRLHVWLCLSAAGFLYWGVVRRFANSAIDHFAGPLWFGGAALLLHWFTNRAALSNARSTFMSGLRRICKLYGGMAVTGNDGKTVRYVWDYASDGPAPESEMPVGSERHKASERARWQTVAGVNTDGGKR